MYRRLLIAICSGLFLFSSCSIDDIADDTSSINITSASVAPETEEIITSIVTTQSLETTFTSITESTTTISSETIVTTSIVDEALVLQQFTSLSLEDIPSFSGEPYIVVNDNIPFFNYEDISVQSFEKYSLLDQLGRCGVCVACIGKDIMPTTKREGIGMIKPTGWHLDKYDFIEGKYLYNRCHIIGFQLTGENANINNLITGTRFLNVSGMERFENKVANYVKNTDNHVMYRSTPYYEGDNLLATGVLIEALSVEDNGEGICFNVFCYNAQPNVVIDYATGDNWLDENYNKDIFSPIEYESENYVDIQRELPVNDDKQSEVYILNTNTKKVHYPWCSSVEKVAEHNKQEYIGSIDEVVADGYQPCKICNP